MAQSVRFSRLAGGRLKNGTRGRYVPRRSRRVLPVETVAMLLAFVATAWIGGYFISDGMLLSDLTPDRQRSVPVSAQFDVCSGTARITCVVDGDTIWFEGRKIRIADIDTPEVSQPSCSHELVLGNQATARLTELLNAGPFELVSYEQDQDVYGRDLRLVMRNGHSLGDVLIREGLAHAWDGSRHSWCG